MVGINIVDLTTGPLLVLHFHHAVHAQIFMIHEFITAKPCECIFNYAYIETIFSHYNKYCWDWEVNSDNTSRQGRQFCSTI